MRCPNPNCNRLLFPNLNGRIAHVVPDDINALDIGGGVNFCSYCGTPLPVSHHYPLPIMARAQPAPPHTSHVPGTRPQYDVAPHNPSFLFLKSTSELL